VKVLFLAHSFPRFAEDPVGSFVLRLALALRPLDVEVEVIAPASPGLPARDRVAGVPVRRFRYAPRALENLAYSGTMRQQVQGSWIAKAGLLGLVISEYVTTRRMLREFQADLLHAHWWFPAGWVGSYAAPPRRVPLVTTLHGSDLRLAQSSRIAAPLFRRVMRRSAVVTTVSRWLSEGTTALVPDVRPTIAPMPVDDTLFRPGGDRRRDRLLFVGKLNAQKGIDHLLHALAMMRHRPMIDIVVGVGSVPTDAQALAERLGLTKQLQWHPLVAQAALAEFFRTATALVAPFVDEGLGLVVVEAQLCEAPVVAFRSGGLPDIVQHERTGLLVSPGDPGALATALDRLLDLEDQGAEWGREGRRHAVATFAPSAAAGRYLEVYRRVIGAGVA